MTATEYGVVDFLEDCTQTGRYGITVLREHMALDGRGTCSFLCFVNLAEEVLVDNIARIEHNGNIVEFELWQVINGQLQGFST